MTRRFLVSVRRTAIRGVRNDVGQRTVMHESAPISTDMDLTWTTTNELRRAARRMPELPILDDFQVKSLEQDWSACVRSIQVAMSGTPDYDKTG
jgi:hypothetical protein